MVRCYGGAFNISSPFAVKWLNTFLRGAGWQPYRVLTDAEPLIRSLATAAVDDLANCSYVVRALAGSHPSVGPVEKWHAELHGTTTGLRVQLEANLGENISSNVFLVDSTCRMDPTSFLALLWQDPI